MTRSIRLAFAVPFLVVGLIAGCGDSMKSDKMSGGMKKEDGMMKKDDGMMKDGMKKDEGMMKDGMKKDGK